MEHHECTHGFWEGKVVLKTSKADEGLVLIYSHLYPKKGEDLKDIERRDTLKQGFDRRGRPLKGKGRRKNSSSSFAAEQRDKVPDTRSPLQTKQKKQTKKKTKTNHKKKPPQTNKHHPPKRGELQKEEGGFLPTKRKTFAAEVSKALSARQYWTGGGRGQETKIWRLSSEHE